jgi:hypothetical protein
MVDRERSHVENQVSLDCLDRQISVRVTGPYQAAVSSASAACTASLM